MNFPIKDFFSKCDQISRFLRIWWHLLKKSLMENFIFCAVAWLSLLQTLFCESFLRFGQLLIKLLPNLTSGSLSARLLLEFKIANTLNFRCAIVEPSQVLIYLAIENYVSSVAVVAPLTNIIFTMVMIFFIKSLSFVERALRIDKTSSKWTGFSSPRVVLMIKSPGGSADGSVSSPTILRKLPNSCW